MRRACSCRRVLRIYNGERRRRGEEEAGRGGGGERRRQGEGEARREGVSVSVHAAICPQVFEEDVQ